MASETSRCFGARSSGRLSSFGWRLRGDGCRGTIPTQAARSFPLRNPLPLPIAAIRAVAVTGPIPGMVVSLWRASFCSAVLWIIASRMARKLDLLESADLFARRIGTRDTELTRCRESWTRFDSC
jgi:hypothetical protein